MNRYIPLDPFHIDITNQLIKNNAKPANIANSLSNQHITNDNFMQIPAKFNSISNSQKTISKSLAGKNNILAVTTSCNNYNSATLAQIAALPKCSTKYVYVNIAPQHLCLKGECDYCCLPVIDYQPFAYCKKIAFPVLDIFNDFGACPSGNWWKRPDHYKKLLAEMGDEHIN